MKTNLPKQCVLSENSACAGPVTRKMVRERAVELAGINGRSAQDASKTDWDEAKRELVGKTDIDAVPGSTGQEAPVTTSEDRGRRASDRLFDEGVREATHDRMLQSAEAAVRKAAADHELSAHAAVYLRDPPVVYKVNSIVAIYPSHSAAEAAIKELQQSGFDMRKLSIVGRDYHTDEHVVGYYNAGDRMKVWGKTGAFWGGIWGLLFGSAFFWIPGLGPLLVAGPLVSLIVGALEGAAVLGGLSAIGAGLFSLGIPKDSVLQYETAIKTGKFVLVAHGSMEDTTHAKEILGRTQMDLLEHHQ
jgi:hypothetical protein